MAISELKLPAGVGLQVWGSAAEQARGLAAEVAGRLRSALAEQGQALLVVSGGRSPVAFLEALSEERQYFTEQRALHAYIQQQAPNVRQADAAAPQAQIDPAALQGMVTASAAQAGLSVERLDNEGEGAVQVALQPAPFAKLLPWLEQLNGQGVQVAEAGLDRQVDGRVSARLSLRVE